MLLSLLISSNYSKKKFALTVRFLFILQFSIKRIIFHCFSGSKKCTIQANVGIGCAPRIRVEKLSDEKLVTNGCQDMAVLPNGNVEGPVTITCDIAENVGGDGKITKCCPPGQVLDSHLKYCEEESKGGLRKLLPNRMVRDPLTGMSTGHYHLEIQPPFCGLQGQVPVFKEPTYVLTNGTVYFQEQRHPSTYECLDRYRINGRTSQVPAAMVCQTILEPSSPMEKGPQCDGQPEFCVPKCCPKDEIFVLDQGINR